MSASTTGLRPGHFGRGFFVGNMRGQPRLCGLGAANDYTLRQAHPCAGSPVFSLWPGFFYGVGFGRRPFFLICFMWQGHIPTRKQSCALFDRLNHHRDHHERVFIRLRPRCTSRLGAQNSSVGYGLDPHWDGPTSRHNRRVAGGYTHVILIRIVRFWAGGA